MSFTDSKQVWKNPNREVKPKLSKETSYWTLFIKYLPEFTKLNHRSCYYSREIEIKNVSEKEALQKAYKGLERLRIERERSQMVEYSMLFRNKDNACVRVWLPNRDGHLSYEEFQEQFQVNLKEKPRYKLWLTLKWDGHIKLGWEKNSKTWLISDIDPQRGISGEDVLVRNCILALKSLGSSLLAKAVIYQQSEEVHTSGPHEGKPISHKVATFNQLAQMTPVKTDKGKSFLYKVSKGRNYPIENLGIANLKF